MTSSMAGQLVAVCRVHTLTPAPHGRQSAIDKRPIDGPVQIGSLGVDGDRQMDHRHHGGRDAALYVYASEALAYWSAELGRELAPGTFGDNLTTRGIDVNSALSGEQWLIGDLEDPGHVVVEVTDPRIPCATFALWMGEPQWVRRFAAHGEPGTYLTVVRPGQVAAGAQITKVADGVGPSIGEQFARQMRHA